MDKLYSSNLKYGSKGEDVIKWKKYLNLYGAELDETNDVFDADTEYWTKDLQNMNELDETGIVDASTWERFGFTPITPAGTAPDKPVFNNTPTDLPTIDTTPFASTSEGIGLKEKYSKAETALSGYTPYVQKKYQSQWDDEIKTLMEQITGREKFSYDVNEDALYQQMKDQYIENGKLAMGDAMAKAAAMTGGYGSSYGQSVGQQAFQGELGKLNDAIPELYQMAIDRYRMEGDELLDQYGILTDRDDREYGRHMDSENIRYQLKQDEYERLLNDLGIAGDDYDRAMEMYYADQDRQNAAEWQEYDASEEARKYANSLLQKGYENEMGEWTENNKNEWLQKEWERDEERYQDSRNDDTDENKAEDGILSDIPAEIVSQLQGYTTEAGQADYLASLTNQGLIDENQAIALLDQYAATDLVNRSWELIDDGGANLFGIDRNAKVSDGTKTYTLAELRKELMKTMSRKEANDWIKQLMDDLEI